MKVLFAILESKNQTTEELYLKSFKKEIANNKIYRFMTKKFDIQIVSDNITTKHLTIDSTISSTLPKTVFFIIDNDNKETTEKFYELINPFKEKYKKIKFLTFLPPENQTFEYFLLSHYDTKTFSKNKTKTNKFFKDNIDENYKSDDNIFYKVWKNNQNEKYKKFIFK